MTTPRQRVSTGTMWERTLGYCRALRVGPHVHVSGTTAVDADGRLVGPGDAYVQARHILRRIEAALGELGATLADVVRTRLYLTDLAHWDAVARAHAEVFGDHPPASTLVEISRLMWPGMLVEIEAEAFVDAQG